jgi:ADP-ribose pyrophosphatase YjhB (NUDIX family)
MTWVEPERWYAQLASFYAAAAALITDHGGHVLLVKPNYRSHWVIPGGYVDQKENPQEALVRELREKLSHAVRPGHLLVVDWASPAGRRPRPIISFLFDCGQAKATDLTINTDELDTFGFYEPGQCR